MTGNENNNNKNLEPKQKNIMAWVAGILMVVVVMACIIKSVENQTTIDSSTKSIKTESQLNADYQEGIQQIKNGNWEEATAVLKGMNYKESKELYNYANAQSLNAQDFLGTGITENNIEHLQPVLGSLNKIDKKYSGPFAQDIANFKTETEQRMQELQASLAESKKAIEEENKITPGCRKLRMGMGQGDAEVSMGKPYKINRSVGSWGIHEQWCYPGGVYLYFEDGALSSWQD